MGDQKIKTKCQHCAKIFISHNLIKSCAYHFCNECIYLWISNSLVDSYMYTSPNSKCCAEELRIR